MHHQILSAREKILALVAAVLLLMFTIVGYSQAAKNGLADVLSSELPVHEEEVEVTK